jgi:uncharacterized membrane protein YoaK (UPF0700 family)
VKAEPWDKRYALLLGLTSAAGTLDALAFLYLGKVFNSFQSGDVIFLGLGIGDGNGGLVIRAAASLIAFVIGAAIGARLVGARLKPSAVHAELDILAVEAALLAIFAALWLGLGTPADHPAARVVLLALGASAMGVQIALCLAMKIPNVLTVALTATLGYIGQRIGDAEQHRKAELPPMSVLIGVCVTYAVCAFTVAVLPETPTLSLLPLALLTAGMALDSKQVNRAWRAA